MYRYSIYILSIFVIIVVISCAVVTPKLGTGGRRTVKKIEKYEHPAVPDGVTCFVCHKEDIPDFEFHKKYGNKCENCHDKATWMAYKYPHPAWPLDEVHRTRCTRCHTKASEHDFNFYQCWGCHHDENETKKDHAKRGIDDVSRCIVCHKDTVKK